MVKKLLGVRMVIPLKLLPRYSKVPSADSNAAQNESAESNVNPVEVDEPNINPTIDSFPSEPSVPSPVVESIR